MPRYCRQHLVLLLSVIEVGVLCGSLEGKETSSVKTLGLNDELTDLTTHVTADSTVTLAVVCNVGLVSILPGQAFSASSQARTVLQINVLWSHV